MVAYATEVDKRRRSTDSNSPVRPNSNLSNNDDNINIQFQEKTNTPATNLKNNAKIDATMDDVFLNNQQQAQQFHGKTTNNSSSSAMKFKSNNVYSGPRGVVSANSPYARAMPVHR